MSLMSDAESCEAPLLAARGVTKAFGATVALSAFDFALRRGSIHALVGENGAGKSTFIKVLAGLHRHDAGTLDIVSAADGRPAIAFIHQDLGLIPGMSVAENVLLGSTYPRRAGLIDWPAVNRMAARSLASVGAELDPAANIDRLSMADRALVAIARAVRLEARILVLDEPTATLPGNDVSRLFDVLRRLRADGIGMIYVSHRLREILSIADEVTVVRDGRLSHHGPAAGLTEAALVEHMVGHVHAAPVAVARREALGSTPALALSGFGAANIEAIDLAVAPGEIVGCVGLRGAGQETLGRALVGLERFTGSAQLGGKPYRPADVADALGRGVAFITGDRDAAIVRTMTVLENLFLNPRFTVLPKWLRFGRGEASETERVIRDYDVRPRLAGKAIGELSGGNAQKVVFARGLESSPVLVVLDDPTAGVDMPTRFALYDLMRRRAADGMSFLIASSDHDEVAAVCDRIHVFRDGRIATTLDAQPFNPEQIAALASAGA